MNGHHHHHSDSVATTKKQYYTQNDENTNNNKSSTMCRFFKSGKCLSGKSCKFSHDLSIAVTENHYSENGANGLPSPAICKYYSTGYCRSGSKCSFQHVENGGEKKMTLTPITLSSPSTPTAVATSPAVSVTPLLIPPPGTGLSAPHTPNSNSINHINNSNNIISSPRSKFLFNENNHIESNNNTAFENGFFYNSLHMSNGGGGGFLGPIPTLPILETITNSHHHHSEGGYLHSPLTPKSLNNSTSLPLTPKTNNNNIITPLTPKSNLLTPIYIDDNQNNLNNNTVFNHLNHHHQPHVDINNHTNTNTTPTPLTPTSSSITNIQLSKSPLLGQPTIALSPTRGLQFTNSLSFLPSSPRTVNNVSSSPTSPFSPHHSLLSSSPSPFFAAPIPVGFTGTTNQQDATSAIIVVDEDEEEDDDDDDELNDPSGLIIIDDNYDDNVFDPFEYREIPVKNYLRHSEEILLNQQKNQLKQEQLKQEQIKQKDLELEKEIETEKEKEIELKKEIDNSSDSNEEERSDDDDKKSLSYLDVLKLNLPKDYFISYENQPGMLGHSQHGHGKTDKSEILCHFFIQGSCRNGDTCKYVHGEKCEVCSKPMLVPGNQEQNEAHMTECLISREKQIQRESMKNLECGICFDSIVEKGRRFGLLSHCNHVFCLECIREWRLTANNPSNTPISTPLQSTLSIRLCPLCRVNSHYIIPANIFVADEKKQEIIEIYKTKLSTIPCKYFNKGKGTCKFGTSCMYAHLNPDGTPFKPQVRKVQTAYGDVTLYNNQLGMFFPEDEEDEDEDYYESEEEEETRKEGFENDIQEDFEEPEEEAD